MPFVRSSPFLLELRQADDRRDGPNRAEKDNAAGVEGAGEVVSLHSAAAPNILPKERVPRGREGRGTELGE